MPTPEGAVLDADQRRSVRARLAPLPADQRRVHELRVVGRTGATVAAAPVHRVDVKNASAPCRDPPRAELVDRPNPHPMEGTADDRPPTRAAPPTWSPPTALRTAGTPGSLEWSTRVVATPPGTETGLASAVARIRARDDPTAPDPAFAVQLRREPAALPAVAVPLDPTALPSAPVARSLGLLRFPAGRPLSEFVAAAVLPALLGGR